MFSSDSPYVLDLRGNFVLKEIDLSSLEEIRGSGILWNNNPSLCFVGNVTRFVVTDSPNCVARQRGDAAECSKSQLIVSHI